MSAYVDYGYVESGYFEGDAFALPSNGNAKLKFFISRGSTSQEDEIDYIQGVLNDEEIGILYAPNSKKFLFVNKETFVEFVTNALDISKVESYLKDSQSFVDSIAFNAADRIKEFVANSLIVNEEFRSNVVNFVANALSVNVSLKAPDGTILASPVVQRDGTTFSFDVPPELSGIEYGVVIEIRGA